MPEGPEVSGASVTVLQRKVLQFYQEQPHAVETARGIATWLGAPGKEVQEALEGLVQRKWLTAHEASAVTGYALTREQRSLEQIRQTLESS